MHRTAVWSLWALLLGTLSAQAHHSFALFDISKSATVEGVVKDVQWLNPHTWIDVTVLDANNVESVWAFEGPGPNMLYREGWTKDMLKPGDRITLTIFPMRDGSKGGAVREIKLPNGNTMPIYTFTRPQ